MEIHGGKTIYILHMCYNVLYYIQNAYETCFASEK